MYGHTESLRKAWTGGMRATGMDRRNACDRHGHDQSVRQALYPAFDSLLNFLLELCMLFVHSSLLMPSVLVSYILSSSHIPHTFLR